jgi:lipid-A-disaccharide synthase
VSGPLRILISAGEVSGDLYAAQLAVALNKEAEGPLDLKAVAGERTRRAGAELLGDSASRAALGFVTPLRYLAPSLVTASRILSLIRHWQPHVVVLLDYPGFNIPLSDMIRRLSTVPLVYYLPPEECIWSLKGAGRVNRTPKVVNNCDCLLTTHEVDTAFYSAAGATVARVGHPLLDLVDQDPISHRDTEVKRNTTVALLPASRRQEIGLLWPSLSEAAALMARARPELEFLVPLAASHLRPALTRACETAQLRYPRLVGRLRLVEPTPEKPNATLTAAWQAGAALSKSGSVTLELALAGVPHLLAFRIDRITEWLGRHLLHLSERDFPHIALPNFILGRELVPEFKQHAIHPARMAETALKLLDPDSQARAAQLAGFTELRTSLGGAGAARRGARLILEIARTRRQA